MKLLPIALLALLAPSVVYAADEAARPVVTNQGMAEYAAHLQSLLPLVNGCASARNSVACDPSKVGSDDEVVLASGEDRMIRFQWLRALLEKAQKPDAVPDKSETKQKSAKEEKADAKKDSADEDKPPAPGDILKIPVRPVQATTGELLKRASDRLTSDLEQAQKYTSAQIDPHAKEHAALKQVLSESAFRNLNTDTPKNRFLEKLMQWINTFFEKINSFGASAPWIGKTLLIGFFVLVGVLLVWSLIQSERRLRLRLTPEGGFVPGAGAASARDWQLWLKDAEAAAAAREWREAIHFIYWASISRLESLRLWPADRARTPREYLALVKIEDPRRTGLQTLTRSFERTWYGGRMAEEEEYKAASEIAKGLIQSGGSR